MPFANTPQPPCYAAVFMSRRAGGGDGFTREENACNR